MNQKLIRKMVEGMDDEMAVYAAAMAAQLQTELRLTDHDRTLLADYLYRMISHLVNSTADLFMGVDNESKR